MSMQLRDVLAAMLGDIYLASPPSVLSLTDPKKKGRQVSFQSFHRLPKLRPRPGN